MNATATRERAQDAGDGEGAVEDQERRLAERAVRPDDHVLAAHGALAHRGHHRGRVGAGRQVQREARDPAIVPVAVVGPAAHHDHARARAVVVEDAGDAEARARPGRCAGGPRCPRARRGGWRRAPTRSPPRRRRPRRRPRCLRETASAAGARGRGRARSPGRRRPARARRRRATCSRRPRRAWRRAGRPARDRASRRGDCRRGSARTRRCPRAACPRASAPPPRGSSRSSRPTPMAADTAIISAAMATAVRESAAAMPRVARRPRSPKARPAIGWSRRSSTSDAAGATKRAADHHDEQAREAAGDAAAGPGQDRGAARQESQADPRRARHGPRARSSRARPGSSPRAAERPSPRSAGPSAASAVAPMPSSTPLPSVERIEGDVAHREHEVQVVDRARHQAEEPPRHAEPQQEARGGAHGADQRAPRPSPARRSRARDTPRARSEPMSGRRCTTENAVVW